jgi:hypothetical protein
VALHDLHPPQEVVRAYHDVTRAMETRDLLVNRAEADALMAVRVQEGKNLEVVRQAEAAKVEKVRQAEARRDAFRARYAQRSRLDAAREWELLRDAWRAVLNGQALDEAGRDYRRRRGEALAVQEMLTDFRLFWDTLGAALAGRDKVLIDADKVPGRRGLWMLPGEPPRWPMQAPERGQRTAPREEP